MEISPKDSKVQSFQKRLIKLNLRHPLGNYFTMFATHKKPRLVYIGEYASDSGCSFL